MCYPKTMIVGGHVSIAGSFDKSIDRTLDIGANALQTFASSPRSLKTTEFPSDILEKYKQKKLSGKIGPHFFHGVYLINLAHESQNYVQASIESLIFYQQLAGKINGEGTIFHIGSHKGLGFERVKKQVIAAIEKALINTPDGVTLFLENAAGQKGSIGANLKELRYIYDSISSKELQGKLGVCYDTQHGFSSGFDIRDSEKVELSISQIDNFLDLNLIKVIHLNDSMVEHGSHRDRHENIGEGFIGVDGLKSFVNHELMKDLPFLLEVPGKNRSGPRKEDVDKLKDLFIS